MKTNLAFPLLPHPPVAWCGSLRPLGLSLLVIVSSSELVLAERLRPGAAAVEATMEILPLGPGPIRVRATSSPARWSFDLPQGQRQLAVTAAGDAAAAAMDWAAIEPRLDIFASALGVVAAPVVAGTESMRAARERLPAGTLEDAQAGLVRALSNVVQHSHLRDAILQGATRNGAHQFVLGITDRAVADSPGSAVLETTVTEVRLERLGKRDASFALRIVAHTRLLRAGDEAVLRHSTYTYQTGPDLFLDWAMNGGAPLQQCAQTGYRQLARQILADVAALRGEAPLQIGAGRNLESHPRRALGNATLTCQVHPVAVPPALFHRATLPIAEAGNLYVFAAPRSDLFAVQKPETREAARSESMEDLLWTLDGLDRHPNAAVAITALAVMSPVGLYHQTIGLAVNGVNEKTLRQANPPIAAAIQNAQPSRAVATQFARQLGQRDFGNVVLLTQPGAAPAQLARAPTAPERFFTTAWPGPAAEPVRAGDQWIRIEVVQAALKGAAGSNPKLAVCLEARVSVRSVLAGEEFYAGTARYQGVARKYAQWAAHDARLLRAELEHSFAELSRAALDQMLAHGWRRPAPPAAPTLAGYLN